MENKKQEPVSRNRRVVRILLAVAAVAAFVSISWVLWSNLRENVWAYYTDDADTTVGVEENKVRYVLWEDPDQPIRFGGVEKGQPDPDKVDIDNRAGERMEATFSPNGTTMVIVRRDNNVTGTDLYASQWNGRIWSRPQPMLTLNSLANDRGPSFSHDGKHL